MGSVAKPKVERTRENDDQALERYKEQIERERAAWFAHVAERNRQQQERRRQRQVRDASTEV